MKHLLLPFLGAVTLAATGCDDKETPFFEFEELGKGAIPRAVVAPNGTFNLDGVDTSSVSFEVEFFDENDGRDVAEYVWEVAYAEEREDTTFEITAAIVEADTMEVAGTRDSTVTISDTTMAGGVTTITQRDSTFAVPDTVTVIDTTRFVPADTTAVIPPFSREFGPVTIASRTASEFEINDAGLPATSFTITLAEVLEALDIPADSVSCGEAFDFNATLTKTDGSTFTFGTTSTNLRGQPTFAALFGFSQEIECGE